MSEFKPAFGVKLKNIFDSFDALQDERMEKDIYLLAGSVLVNIKLVAEKNELRGTGRISCVVTEIDGREISAEEQKNCAVTVQIYDGKLPTPEQQLGMVKKALGHWNIFDKPVRVSEGYVEGHLKTVRMRQKMSDDKGGNVDVFG